MRDGLPSHLEISFLHSGKTVVHEFSGDEVEWKVTGTSSAFRQPFQTASLKDDLTILYFTKRPRGAPLHTFLVMDLESGFVLDATFDPGGEGTWRYDRGSLGSRLRIGTSTAFPRILDPEALTGSPAAGARAFRARADVIVASRTGPPAIEVLMTDHSGTVTRRCLLPGGHRPS